MAAMSRVKTHARAKRTWETCMREPGRYACDETHNAQANEYHRATKPIRFVDRHRSAKRAVGARLSVLHPVFTTSAICRGLSCLGPVRELIVGLHSFSLKARREPCEFCAPRVTCWLEIGCSWGESCRYLCSIISEFPEGLEEQHATKGRAVERQRRHPEQ